MNKRIGSYPHVRVQGDGGAVVSQAGGVLLVETARKAGLDTAISAAPAPWRKPRAVHDPGKVLLDLAGDGDALDGIRTLPTGERTFGSAAASVGRWDIHLGRCRVPPYAARRHFARSLSVPADGKKTKAERSLSPPLLTYSALGGLRQDPGGGAKSSAEAITCGNGDTTCVCCRRIGDEVTLNQWWDRQCGRECSGRLCGCARRPTGRSGRPTRQREDGQRRGGA